MTRSSMFGNTLVAFRTAVVVLIPVLALTGPARAVTTVVVPGTSDPWLAGWPAATTAQITDVAPAQSPVLVPLALPAGGWVEFSSATGTVGNEFGGAASVDFPSGPEGAAAQIRNHLFGPQNSISDMFAPINSLVGIFLNASTPSGVAPSTLLFETGPQRDYLTLSPVLNQVFFIGDGQASGPTQQKVFIPAGATRLFLGTMDGWDWNNNYGSFTVDVSAVPEPMTLALLAIGGSAVFLKSRRKRPC